VRVTVICDLRGSDPRGRVCRVVRTQTSYSDCAEGTGFEARLVPGAGQGLESGSVLRLTRLDLRPLPKQPGQD